MSWIIASDASGDTTGYTPENSERNPTLQFPIGALISMIFIIFKRLHQPCKERSSKHRKKRVPRTASCFWRLIAKKKHEHHQHLSIAK
jgi:hypothetical protein